MVGLTFLPEAALRAAIPGAQIPIFTCTPVLEYMYPDKMASLRSAIRLLAAGILPWVVGRGLRTLARSASLPDAAQHWRNARGWEL